MIKKFNNFGKVNENETTDYYDMFEVDDAHHMETIEKGTIDLYAGDKHYYFNLEMGDGFTDVILDKNGNENAKEELESMGITFSTKPDFTMWVDDEDFEDYIQDMYNETVI